MRGNREYNGKNFLFEMINHCLKHKVINILGIN
jgi:hypothetical protein